MIPLKDLTAPRKIPAGVCLIIALNLMAFLFELTLNRRELQGLVYLFGVIPARFFSSDDVLAIPDQMTMLSMVTSMFLHGGWTHILGNMLYLWVFGKSVESRLGHGRFLLFYLLSGIGAAIVHVVFNIDSPTPTLGASGAVAGVLGAYIVTFPQGRILTLVPFIFLLTLELPAVIVIGVWFITQLFNGTAAIVDPRQMSGVAWWAHIGGFVVGILLMKVLQPPRRSSWDYEGPYYSRHWDR
ncbi:MAG: rhomboid family intramembrane serine protease [Acidobacteria bacterium]|nr:rhomboid family intramembrane serine protease [Acidobacteriota bacterium]MBI3655384.1 rhomboid family intramembrane serine protease [Acidobacteriota bacterium]